MRFYLGTHETSWLDRSPVALFCSYLRFPKRKRPRARTRWALDSAGYSVLTTHGRHLLSAREYAALVRDLADNVGQLDWAACQDWMCEAEALSRTGLDVPEHQRRTVRSFIELRDLAPELPFVPVLQGVTRDQYMRCADMYDRAGIDLAELPTVGIGSICRREDTTDAERIVKELAAAGIRLHGFGMKLGGLERCAGHLASADSLAWSYRGRVIGREQARKARTPSLFDAPPAIDSPQNSPRFALDWLSQIEARAGLKDAPELSHCCPSCGGDDVHPDTGSGYTCVACGESWTAGPNPLN